MNSRSHENKTPSVNEETVDVSPVSSHGTTTVTHTSQASEHEKLTVLIEKNIKWSQVIYNQNRKIQRRLSWIVFGSYLRLFLILIPVILGIIYLPPLISDFWAQYGSAVGASGQTFREYLDLLKSLQ